MVFRVDFPLNQSIDIPYTNHHMSLNKDKYYGYGSKLGTLTNWMVNTKNKAISVVLRSLILTHTMWERNYNHACFRILHMHPNRHLQMMTYNLHYI